MAQNCACFKNIIDQGDVLITFICFPAHLTCHQVDHFLNDARRDLMFCGRKNRLHEWPHALRIRWQQRRARLAGFEAGWKIYREDEIADRINPPLWAEENSAVIR